MSRWKFIFSKLPSLNGLSIARWTGQHSQVVRIELHGFSDASSVAYTAAIYLRVIFCSGKTTTTLIASKSRVAPVTPVRISRLELLAAALLARLISFVHKSLNDDAIPLFCWTDSTIVLAWLRRHPSTWKTFVSNCVAKIQTILPNTSWRHVPTKTNHADCASRGLYGDELSAMTLWWSGPPWLLLAESEWP